MDADEALARARAKRAQAAAEVRRWDDFIETFAELTQTPAARSTDASAAITPVAATAPSGAAVDPNGAYGNKPSGTLLITEQVVANVIREKGKPIPTRDLLVELDRAGIAVGGKDPASTLSARLSRAKSLQNIRPYGWQIRAEHQERAEQSLNKNGAPEGAPDVEDVSASSNLDQEGFDRLLG